MPKQSSTHSINKPATSFVGRSFPDCETDLIATDTDQAVTDSATLVYRDAKLLRPHFVAQEEGQISIRTHLQQVLDRHSEEELEIMWFELATYLSSLSRIRPQKLLYGQAVLGEAHLGTISRLTDSVAVVRYGSGDNQFELEYQRDQFFKDAVLEQGDSIEACVALWREPYRPEGISHYLSEQEQAELQTAWTARKGIVGDLDL